LNKLVDRIISLKLDEIINYNFPYNELFGLEIIEDNVKYEFLIKFSDSNDNLICFGSGAVTRTGPKAINPPVFNRYSWHVYFAESVLYYNDPTRYIDDEMKVGWGVGTADNYYLEVIADIIDKIRVNIKIKENNILFYSSSGGGFTSIQLATLIKGSTALVNNSQMIIKNYYPQFFDRLKNSCFEGLDEETILEKYGYRLNVLEMFKREEYIPPIIYFVNGGSYADIHNQCIPFIEGLSKLPFFEKENNVEVIIYRDEKGHAPLSNEESINLIKLISKKRLYNYKSSPDNDPRTAFLEKELEKYKSRKIVRFTDKLLKIKHKIFNNK